MFTRFILTATFVFLSRLLSAQCNPPVSIAPIPFLCADAQTDQLNATPAGGVWSGNQVSPGGLVNLSNLFGAQYVTYMYSDATCADTVTVFFQVNTGPNVSAGTDFSIVCGNINYLVGAYITGPGNTAFWSTSNGHFVGPVTDPVTPVDEPGTYVLTAVNSSTGCSNRDTVVCYPYLPSFPNTQITDTICQGDALLGYTQSGHFYDKFETGTACDSFRVLHLTVLQPLRDTVVGTTCAGTSVEGYNASGIYRDTFSAVSGCDSIRVLHLTVLPVFTGSISSATCDPALAGVFLFTYTAINGCDSVVTSTVALLPGSDTLIKATICAGEVFEGYGNTGMYTDLFSNQFGCDSSRTIDLTVLPVLTDNLYSSTCDPAQAGVFSTTYAASTGCDSVVTSTVALLPGSDTLIATSICAGGMFEGYNSTGVYTDLFSNQFGCDSSRVIDLTVLPQQVVDSVIQADHGMHEGSISIIPQGGTPPFLFAWSSGDSTATISGLAEGEYVLTLTDGNGCTAVFSFMVPLSVGTNAPGDDAVRLTAIPNPVRAGENARLTLAAPGAGEYWVSVYNTVGNLSRQFVHLHPGETSGFDLSFAESGLYVVCVRDARGRRTWVRVVVSL
ncbi:MAG: hypothetical protein IPJ82_07115 [Lewinellaceae bacterium]|nr:hypothetical protein [Lewinellaceae bacterium]